MCEMMYTLPEDRRAYLLLGREIVHDVEELADLFRSLSLDHVSYSLASNIPESYSVKAASHIAMINLQQWLDIKVVSCENNLEEHLLINGDELLVPLRDVRSTLARLVLALLRICSGEGLATVVLTVLEDLSVARAKNGHQPEDTPPKTLRTFLRTLEETLGSGMGWSLSPTSVRSSAYGQRHSGKLQSPGAYPQACS